LFVTNSRAKGARGEREFAKELQAMGFEARRGQQFSGGKESPDVITNVVGIHWEVKRVEALNLDKAMAQAVTDGGDSVPVVAHRKDRGPWMITIRLDDLLRFVKLFKIPF
jgi:Holliday junction resolvase